MKRRPLLVLAVALPLLSPPHAAAQDTHILFSVETLEERLLHEPFEMGVPEGSRFEGDRTQRVMLTYADGTPILVKWAKAPRGGEAFNNQPRYELAAYRLQKLFLDESDYVVPPTVARVFPLGWYRRLDPGAAETFDGAGGVLVVLQYWVYNVSQRDVYDRRRLQQDTAYARHFGNLNLLTYLIRHSDANLGNVLISADSLRPRMFSVDNGVAFGSPESDRGVEWRNLRVDRLPQGTVDRLRALRREDLDRELGVVAQFQRRDDGLVATPATEPLSRRSGVRWKDGVLQLGLTDREIDGVHARLQALLRRVDQGRIRTF